MADLSFEQALIIGALGGTIGSVGAKFFEKSWDTWVAPKYRHQQFYSDKERDAVEETLRTTHAAYMEACNWHSHGRSDPSIGVALGEKVAVMNETFLRNVADLSLSQAARVFKDQIDVFGD